MIVRSDHPEVSPAVFHGVTPVFCRMSELLEEETAEYHKTNPDPFEDLHPGDRLSPFDLYVLEASVLRGL